MIKPSKVKFISEKLQNNFNSLSDDDPIKKSIKRAIKDLQDNAFFGIQFPKKLIPKAYIQKYEITNLWKYDLPDGWRLVYSIITPNKVEILAVILEWFDHKNYERKFKY